MLAAGRHDVVLSNRTLGYQEARRIEVTAGQTVVDPRRRAEGVGQRERAALGRDHASTAPTSARRRSRTCQITVGTHEMVFRHPQLGERKQTVVVTAKGPNRIAADLTK